MVNTSVTKMYLYLISYTTKSLQFDNIVCDDYHIVSSSFVCTSLLNVFPVIRHHVISPCFHLAARRYLLHFSRSDRVHSPADRLQIEEKLYFKMNKRNTVFLTSQVMKTANNKLLIINYFS